MSILNKFSGSSKFCNIILPILVLIILSLPLVKINQAEISEIENRKLTKFPEFNSIFESAFNKQFDAWLSDRFFLRDDYLALQRQILLINRRFINKKAFVGYDGWQFSNITKSDQTPYSAAKLKKIKNNINYFKDFCDSIGAKCYMVIAPRREDFVGNQPFTMLTKDKAGQVYNVTKNIIPTIYPYKEFQDANKKELVFFKPDHHWTEYGALVAYRELMARIKVDFPEIISVNEGDYEIYQSPKVMAEADRKFNNGATCKLLNLTEKECLDENVQYKYYKIKDKTPRNDLKVAMIGNSFIENFATFWWPTFAQHKKFRANERGYDNLKLTRWKSEIEEFHPSIIILVLNSFYTFKLDSIR